MDERSRVLRTWAIEGVVAAPAVARHLHTQGGSKRKLRVLPAGPGDYPATTDQWCWHCCHPFDTQPLPLPIKYDDRRDVFHVMGTFCSWACMKTFNAETSSYMKAVTANNITLLRKRCTGQLSSVRPAPPRVALRVFGGTMSIEQFREASGGPIHYCVLPPRLIPHHQIVHELEIQQQHRHRQQQRRAVPEDLGAVVSFKDVSTKNETLRLKRPKPLQNNRNLLERTMGIGPVGASV